MAVEEEPVSGGPTTVTVESGAFTISSTVGQVPYSRTPIAINYRPLPHLHTQYLEGYRTLPVVRKLYSTIISLLADADPGRIRILLVFSIFMLLIRLYEKLALVIWCIEKFVFLQSLKTNRIQIP